MTSDRRSSGSWLIATWFGCGYAPKGPGTAGAAAAILIAWLLSLAGLGRWGFLTLSALALFPAIKAADRVARESGRKDPQIVVVDEVLGQWLTLAGAVRLNWRSFLLAFVLFRAFDILKPPPIRLIERAPGGAGIVLDDMMAGVYAALVLFLLGWFNLNYRIY
ncbi:MAG TPA: phosphatidylglycerophosphatase A [Bryobacteraceae bacterium]|nr:phosphatidylglycerophosphatase A [Bryobacteraceae bacterium]